MISDTLTVLIVDDEPQIRRLVRHALQADRALRRGELDDAQASPELRVLEAETGREGIDLAAAEEPALVVLDLGLPDMDGIAVCRVRPKYIHTEPGVGYRFEPDGEPA